MGYNGAFKAGVLALPPCYSSRELCLSCSCVSGALRLLFGGTEHLGQAQTRRLGKIQIRTLYICGTRDRAILGCRPFALKTEEHCVGGYSCFMPDCGHSFQQGGQWNKEVVEKILAHLNSVS